MLFKQPPLPTPNIVSHTLHLDGQPCRIHGLSTGSVAVKQSFAYTPHHNLFGRLSFLWTRAFTDFIPIWTWVIEHPTAGVFLVDTGERSAVNDPDFFRPSGRFAHWLNTRHFQFRVPRSEEIDQLLPLVGL